MNKEGSPCLELRSGKREVAYRVCQRASKVETGIVRAKVLRPGLRDVWGQVEASGEGWTMSGL